MNHRKIVRPQLLTKTKSVNESSLWLSCISDAVKRLLPPNKPNRSDQEEIVKYILNLSNDVKGNGRDFHRLVQVLIALCSVDLSFSVCSYAVELFKGNCDLLADAFQLIVLLHKLDLGHHYLELANEIDPAYWTTDLFYRIIKWNITIVEDIPAKQNNYFTNATELCLQLRKRDPTGERSYYLQGELFRLIGQENDAIQTLRTAIFEERHNAAGVFNVRCPICCYKLLEYIRNSDDYGLIRDTCAYGIEYTLNANEVEIFEECRITKQDLWQLFVLTDRATKEAEAIRKKHDMILDAGIDIRNYHPYNEYYSIYYPITKENIVNDLHDGTAKLTN